jgi:hypothetical protein
MRIAGNYFLYSSRFVRGTNFVRNPVNVFFNDASTFG